MLRWLRELGVLPLVLMLTASAATAVVARDSEPLPDARRVTAGDTHICAEWWHGASCWGDNNDGQLGNGTQRGLLLAPFAPPKIEPQAVLSLPPTPTGQPFASLDAGPGRTCGLATGQAGTAEGQVWCWGEESALGRVDFDTRAWTAAGGAHTCVFRDEPGATYEDEFEMSHAVYCWGANDRGQLGDGSRDDRTGPVRAVGLDPAKGVFDLALGRTHSCVVTGESATVSHPDPTMGGISSHRSLRCWGANERGQLGTGDREDQSRPSTVVMTGDPMLASVP